MTYLHDRETQNKICTKYLEVIEKFDDILIKNINKNNKLISKEAIKYSQHGLARRTLYLKECVERFYEIFQLEIDGKEISRRVRFDQTVLLNFFFMNISGGIDNLAWVYALEHNFDHKSHFDISFKKKDFKEILPNGLVEILNKHHTWLSEHVTDFRNSSAHRIMPYVPPFIQIENTDNRIYESVYTHDFDNSPTVQFHPQVICDALGYLEIIGTGVELLDGNRYLSQRVEIMPGELVRFKFEWDVNKSILNEEKDRPSFKEVVKMFVKFYPSTIQRDSNKDGDESRQEIILTDDLNKNWKLVFVVRNETVRIISFHRK